MNLIHRRKLLVAIAVGLMFLTQAGLGPVRADEAGDGPADTFVESGVACRVIGPAPFGVAPISTCPGVRPGSYAYIAGSGTCTLGFLFVGSDGKRYISTAGHCVPALYDPLDPFASKPNEVSYPDQTGPEVQDLRGTPIGNVAYGHLGGTHDFALIRLNLYGQTNSNPQMCYFGGPTGVNTDINSSPMLLHHYGNGLGAGQSVPARSATAPFGLPSSSAVIATGLGISGDSGSPVIGADGRAIGLLVATGAIRDGTSQAGTLLITRPFSGTSSQVDKARQKLGLSSLTLQTAAF